MDTLDIFQGLQFNEAITKKQLHTYYPRVSNFKTSDEIRISIQHQDVYTLPSESFIYIEGKFKHDAAGTGTCELTNNAYAFLFDQIRYEINGVEVDRCTKPGITSSIKGYISYGDNETKFLEMSGWCPNSKTQPTISLNNKFNAYIPLKFFLGFAEDYKKIIINASQELILLRSGNDLNCYHNTTTGGTKVASFDIDKIEWHVPHINVNDEIRLKLLKTLKSSYYNRNNQPLLSYEKFKECALYVIDCANQKEAVKSSIVDVKLELESLSGFTEDTTAYCLIIHDNIVEYTPLSGTVKKII
ncbi:hypothetical protein QE152_g14157 [Popillia japonica]|uniref:Double jelly roll-like domain-containing protein n=1 Tax=Popillia japonica TaxID=7064 RepID=A0AAW1LAY8_POPJA